TVPHSRLTLVIWRAPRLTPFPYTTLFRSRFVARARPGEPGDGGAGHGHRPLDESGHPEHSRPGVDGHAAAARRDRADRVQRAARSEEHTSELQSRENLVCRLLLEQNKTTD